MKRIVACGTLLIALLVCSFFPGKACAAEHFFSNRYGTVSISEGGIVSKGSELVAFGQVVATKGHSLGYVNFTMGALLDGTIEGGGHFSSSGSSFIVTGNGNQGVPKGPIFVGAYVGKVRWKLIRQEGEKLVFHLNGRIKGTLYTGGMVELMARQTIVVTEQQLSKGIGHIKIGEVFSSL